MICFIVNSTKKPTTLKVIGLISLNIFEITKPLLITSQGEVVDICKKRDLKILDFFDKEH